MDTEEQLAKIYGELEDMIDVQVYSHELRDDLIDASKAVRKARETAYRVLTRGQPDKYGMTIGSSVVGGSIKDELKKEIRKVLEENGYSGVQDGVEAAADYILMEDEYYSPSLSELPSVAEKWFKETKESFPETLIKASKTIKSGFSIAKGPASKKQEVIYNKLCERFSNNPDLVVAIVGEGGEINWDEITGGPGIKTLNENGVAVLRKGPNGYENVVAFYDTSSFRSKDKTSYVYSRHILEPYFDDGWIGESFTITVPETPDLQGKLFESRKPIKSYIDNDIDEENNCYNDDELRELPLDANDDDYDYGDWESGRPMYSNRKPIKSSLEDRLVPYLEEFEEGYSNAMVDDPMDHYTGVDTTQVRLETFFDIFKNDHNLTDDDINKLENAVLDIWNETNNEISQDEWNEMYGKE